MQRVGIVIGRIGGVDGVALETEKWIHVLGRMGHEVHVLTGVLEGEVANVTVLPQLAFDHASTEWEQAVCFFGMDTEGDPAPVIRERADAIAAGLRKWIDDLGIDLLVSENASALPCHLQMGLAIKTVCEQSKITTITHDHDFAWERGDRYETPYGGVRDIIAEAFPLLLPTVRHAVINLAAKSTLAERFGVGSVVVPNVMDFEVPFAERDDYNASMRADLGLAEDDILLMQVTRIVRRKGIETAIHLVRELANPSIKLVVTGLATDDHKEEYFGELEALVVELGLETQVLFAGSRFANQRARAEDGSKVYSLEDAYAHAAACTYFSTYEGFGNAFVEAVLARCPIFVNRYEPVYWPDIGSKGFEAVMIENSELSAEAVAEMRAVLLDPHERARIAEHNFALGEAHFSYEALEACLRELLPSRAKA